MSGKVHGGTRAPRPAAGVDTSSTPPTDTSSRRPTRQRQWLNQALASLSDFRSAQEIHATLVESGHSVGLATVYRNLVAMATDGDIDVLRTADGEALYRACATGSHHHHLVCRECGLTVEIEGPPAFELWSTRVSNEHGFRATTHTLEIFGTCARH